MASSMLLSSASVEFKDPWTSKVYSSCASGNKIPPFIELYVRLQEPSVKMWQVCRGGRTKFLGENVV